MNEPKVQVPASLFCMLMRLYKSQSQEKLIQSDYMILHQLELRATRKMLHARKEAQK